MIKFIFLLICIAIQVSASEYTIQCKNLFHPQLKKVVGKSTIYVKDEKIIEVLDGWTEIRGEFIDLKNEFVMPGLMDMHVHLHTELNSKRYSSSTQMEVEDYAVNAVVNAEKTVKAGFTTIRDLKSPAHVSIAIRNAVDEGTIIGPRIITAKAIGTTGGHFDPSNSLNKELMWDALAVDGIVDGEQDVYKAVRQAYKDGYDMIKIAATGGVLSSAKSGQNPQFTDEELETLIRLCNDYGFRVAAHAHGTEGIKRAVKAGVTSIEHGTLIDDEGISLMKEKGTYFVPTLSAGNYVAEMAKIEGFFPPKVQKKATSIGPQLQKNFSKIIDSGIKIAFGTDAGVSPHGDNWKEFLYMTQVGMSNMDALVAATTVTSQLIGMEDDLGSIEKGKIADIIAVVGNPLEDITVMGNLVFVMKDGVIVVNK